MSQIKPDDVGLIRILQTETPSSFRLICFPESAHSTAYYLSLSELLLPTVEVLAIQYPLYVGIDDDERLTDSADLADRIFGALGSGWTARWPSSATGPAPTSPTASPSAWNGRPGRRC
ncbi:hypothetical protein SANT12839_037110 [Streptomyces antimycoticus]|uniref:Thioesterase domain-containing protein n=1 Tax=Streptomyces antimycoticus TaxID=68175 RepID=A0A4D4K9G4_9ACTN|nr:hypothetical protein SANT12839_037110 [Streptomyces antimycoticus]